MKVSGIEHDVKAAKTAPAAAVDVPGATGERGVRETEPSLPDPDPGQAAPPFCGDPLFDGGVDEDVLSTKRSKILPNFNLIFKQTHTVLKFCSTSSSVERDEVVLICVDLRATVRESNRSESKNFTTHFVPATED